MQITGKLNMLQKLFTRPMVAQVISVSDSARRALVEARKAEIDRQKMAPRSIEPKIPNLNEGGGTDDRQ